MVQQNVLGISVTLLLKGFRVRLPFSHGAENDYSYSKTKKFWLNFFDVDCILWKEIYYLYVLNSIKDLTYLDVVISNSINVNYAKWRSFKNRLWEVFIIREIEED